VAIGGVAEQILLDPVTRTIEMPLLHSETAAAFGTRRGPPIVRSS
jgi:hypothetical protein